MATPKGSDSSSSSASKVDAATILEPPPVNRSTLSPIPPSGFKRAWSASESPSPVNDPGLCLSDGSASQTVGGSLGKAAAAQGGDPVQNGGTSAGGNGIGTQVQGQQGTDPANAIAIERDEPMHQQSGDEPSGKRPKKCTSDVWNYFTKNKLVIEDNRKIYMQWWAQCNFPKCKFKGRCESNYGTTGFWTHLRTSHSVVKGQQQLKVEKDNEKNIVAVQPYRYDEESSLRKFFLAIVMHEYPFNIAEHEYFVEFIKSLRPSFPIKSRVTIRNEIFNMFKEEKEKLYSYFKAVPSCFSATMDMWTSNQNKSYMFITAHWIDDSWCIQKRIVSFVHVEGRHTGARLSETFTEHMVKWNIDKRIFALTLDNASANEVAVKDIIADLKASGNASSSLVCDGIFFHVRCACHILNLAARDGSGVIAPTLENVRRLVLAVKGSPLQWEELMKRATECGLETNKGLSLDVSTRWNSTYLMLRDALYYKSAFMRLKSSDRRRYEKITPSTNEWAMAFRVFQCLKKFYELTELFSGTLYPTANLFYRGFCEIKLLLDDWCVSGDTTVRTMATAMSKKFEKYWKKSCTTLAVACFFDPRYKKRLVEFYVKKFYENAYQLHVDELVDVIKKLFQFYASSAISSRAGNTNRSEDANNMDIADLLVVNDDDELENYLYDSSGHDGAEMYELDKYMADSPLRFSGQFDVLSWWKGQIGEYPILATIARDLLAVQVSTVASESAFSSGGRVIDPFRSRLDPEMVEALICTKDWVAAARRDKKVGSIVCDFDLIEALVAKLKLEMTKWQIATMRWSWGLMQAI